MNAREAAYIALLLSIRQQHFIVHSLEKWMINDHPSKLDFAFAYEIASGSVRMALTLDYLATQLSKNKKLNLKTKEKALLRTAIYQYVFMEKVPLYAIASESIELAKKYCHKTFVSYLNALLRKLEKNPPSLPSCTTLSDFSIRYSYPLYFVKELFSDYSQKQAEEILNSGNTSPKTMARVRPGTDLTLEAFKFLHLQKEIGLPIAIIDKTMSLSAIASLPEIYIQNVTPVALITSLAERTNTPSRILDLCASPGGKLLAVHDLYPTAQLFANDVSKEKLAKLSENLRKYKIEAELTCGSGENYVSNEPFDIIILDVPCSNSGVLNKRAEARWRLTIETIEHLKKTQLRLIKHATTLLAPEGVIWYLTCSILKKENEGLIQQACQHFGLEMQYCRTILPNKGGWDGGFAALLKRKKSS